MSSVIHTIDSDRNVTIMAVDGPFSVGVANADVHPIEEGWWWLARLKVNERQQGAGLGSLLLYHLLQALSKKDLIGIIVAPGGYGSDERRLEKFYMANGFKKAEEGVLRWRKGDPILSSAPQFHDVKSSPEMGISR